MKKERKYILLLALLVLLDSCSRNVTEDWSGKMLVFRVPHYLGTSSPSFHFDDGKGGMQTITISSKNTSWEICDLPEWIIADKKTGEISETVTLTCSANPSPKVARATVFYVRSKEKDWDYNIPISVSQARCMAYAIPTHTSISFEGKEQSQTIPVTSNSEEWSVSSSESWLKAEKISNGESLLLSVEPNPYNTSRRAYATIQATDDEQQITVDQRAGSISATLDIISCNYEASSKTVSVTADAPWTAQTASSWIEVQPISAGAGTTEVIIRLLANNSFDERTGYVYFVMADNNKVELPVVQGAVTFSLSEKVLEFPHSTTTKSLTINTNAEWELASDLPDWLSISTRDGRGTTEVTITAKEYTSESVSPRNFTLSFKPRMIGTTFDVVISQTGQELNLDANSLQFTNKSGSQSFSFTASGEWTATSEMDWITINPASGSGDASCMVSVNENTGEERIGKIVFSFYDATYDIIVTQQGAFLTLSSNGLQFGSTGGSLNVDISSNTRWDAGIKDNVAWLDVSPESGEDDATLIINAADNPSVNDREGKVIVSPKDRQSLMISVKQAARYLNVGISNIDFLASGGTSELINADTDGELSVITESDWITIDKVGEKSFMVKAAENEWYDSRTGKVIVSVANLNFGRIEQTISVIQEGKKINGYAVVDLGLPSGLLWATCNLGASSPEDCGYYYAWGETEPKNSYDWSTYKWCNGNESTLTKYNTNSSYGNIIDNKTILDLYDDAAYVNWGDSWHTPTKEEWEELFNSENCTWTKNKNCCKITSKRNGNFLILPLAGSYGTSGLISVGSYGMYWSSTLYEEDANHASCLYFFDANNWYVNRFLGLSVRPVCQPTSFFNVSNNSIVYSFSGGIEQISLTTNLSWKAIPSESWITLSSTSGIGNATISVMVEENTSTEVRKGNVVFSAGDYSIKVVITQKGVPYVDMGLSSGLLWATSNLGASSPEEYGDFYSWGETNTKTSFGYSNYKYGGSAINQVTKYNNNKNNGIVDNILILVPSDDAAHVVLGDAWRMPTYSDYEELLEACTSTWKERNGVYGYEVTSSMNGKTLFFPAAGYYDAATGKWITNNEAGFNCGLYWSSSLYEDAPYNAWCLYFRKYQIVLGCQERSYGLSVRPVYENNQ